MPERKISFTRETLFADAGKSTTRPVTLGAILDALRPLGIDRIDMPATPARVAAIHPHTRRPQWLIVQAPCWLQSREIRKSDASPAYRRLQRHSARLNLCRPERPSSD